MIINSNDIFTQIGLAIDPNNKTARNIKPKYTVCLEIQLSENQKHMLEVKDTDDPYTVAYQFCRKHQLNKLAISLVEAKIRQAKEQQEQKRSENLVKSKSITKRNTNIETNLAKSRKNVAQNNISPTRSRNERSNSKTPGKSRTRKQPAVTDNIYLRSLVKLRIIEENKNKIKVEMEKKQQQELTFKPKINNVSEKIIQFLRTNPMPKEKKPSPPKKVYEQMRECTFKPKINKVSERIVSNKSVINDEREKYNEVYKNQSQKPKQRKRAPAQQQYSFKPQINLKSAQKITVPFFKRLEIQQQQRKNSQKAFYDEDQCYFQPKIGRAPFRGRDKQNVWQHLHYQSKKPDPSQNKTTNTSQITKQATASRQYYQNLIEQRIQDVFTILDGNKDGMISPNEISIEMLPPQCLHFLKPIFMEMDEVDATLNYYEFKRAVHALMADSDPGTKGAFIATKWKKQSQGQQTFKPNINKRSKQLTAHRSVENLYKEGVKQRQNKQYRLQKQRALREEKQLAECSFKPNLNRSSKVYMEKIAKRKKQLQPNKSISQMVHSFMKDNDQNQ